MYNFIGKIMNAMIHIPRIDHIQSFQQNSGLKEKLRKFQQTLSDHIVSRKFFHRKREIIIAFICIAIFCLLHHNNNERQLTGDKCDCINVENKLLHLVNNNHMNVINIKWEKRSVLYLVPFHDSYLTDIIQHTNKPSSCVPMILKHIEIPFYIHFSFKYLLLKLKLHSITNQGRRKAEAKTYEVIIQPNTNFCW